MKDSSRKSLKNIFIAFACLLLCFVFVFGFAACGTEGAVGPKGEIGATGDKGDKGDKGDSGDAASSGAIYNPSEAISESSVNVTGTKSGKLEAAGRFYTDFATKDEMEWAAKDVAEQIAAEGFVLLKNENNALPLQESERYVTPLGIRTTNIERSGGGSGTGNSGGSGLPYSNATLQSSLTDAGFVVNERMISLYATQNAMASAYVMGNITESSMSIYATSIVNTYSGYDDAAIVTLSRRGWENGDLWSNNVPGHSNPDEHMAQLDDNEKALIAHAKEHFNKVIVLINSSNIMQIPEIAEAKTSTNLGVDAILWIGGVGTSGINAVGKILNGSVNPSGRTVDIWEKDFTKGPTWTNFGTMAHNKDGDGNRLDTYYYKAGTPATKTNYASLEYREGIYAGYRFYETAATDKNAAAAGSGDTWYDSQVLFPFGYGLSYSDFEWKLDNVSATKTITAANETVTMRVWVKNNGNVPGKDVVQVYVNPPYISGGIEKASANMVGFAKTKLLEPGEAQVVTVKFTAQDMASFDWDDKNGNGFKGYELEAGNYVVSINRNSHEVVDSVTRTVAETIKITKDYYTGNDIKPVFTDAYSTVNATLTAKMISRATGLVQPDAATKADRTISEAEVKIFDDQDTYQPFLDKATDPWYVSAVPANWTQGVRAGANNTYLTISDMAGIPYTEATISASGVATAATDANSLKWEAFMNQLTWREMVDLVAVGGGSSSSGLSVIGLPSISEADGPVGIGSCTLFPSAPIVAATYNVDLAEKQGRLIGDQCIFRNVVGWRGAGANNHRSPLSGRNFEYYSQDGVQGGLIAAAVSRGVTDKGIITYVKHFFGNDQETLRADYGGIATWATEQALRELYAKPFEFLVKQGRASGLMSSFNRLGKVANMMNFAIHENLLRKEWSFTGFTETDMWCKDYMPLNMMVRGGDQLLLSSHTSYPKNALDIGTWDATARSGKGMIKVAANKAEYGSVINPLAPTGNESLLSPTHYYAVRKAAQRLLYGKANSIANRNGFQAGEEIEVYIERGVSGFRAPILLSQTTDFSLTLASGATLPTGLTFVSGTNNTVINSSGTTTGGNAMAAEGEYAVNVNIAADGWISTTAVLKITIGSAMCLNGNNIYGDDPITIARGTAYTGKFDVPSLAHGKVAGGIFVNSYRAPDPISGVLTWYQRDEDKTAADILTIDANNPTITEVRERTYSHVGDLPTGMTFAMEKGMVNGVTSGSYEINVAYVLSGTPTAAGTYTFTVTLTAPRSTYYAPWIFAGAPTMVTYSKTVTIVVT